MTANIQVFEATQYDKELWEIVKLYQPLGNTAYGGEQARFDAWLLLQENPVYTADYNHPINNHLPAIQVLQKDPTLKMLVDLARTDALHRAIVAGYVIQWLWEETFHGAKLSLSEIPRLVSKNLLDLDKASRLLLPNRTLSLKQKLVLLSALFLNPNLSVLLKLAGRYTRQAQALKAKLRLPEDFAGFEMGNKLHRAITGELAMLATRQTSNLLHRKLADNQLQQTKRTSSVPLAKGPIIAVVDASGSMQFAIDYRNPQETREVWARAMVLTLLQVARMEKRDLEVVIYSSRTSRADPGYLTFSFPQGVASLENTIGALNLRPNGDGTEYVPAMKEALNILARQPRADVLWISDGIPTDRTSLAQFIPQFNEKRKEMGARVFGVMIDQIHTDGLKDFCDTVLVAHSLDSLEESTQKLLAMTLEV